MEKDGERVSVLISFQSYCFSQQNFGDFRFLVNKVKGTFSTLNCPLDGGIGSFTAEPWTWINLI